jgi:hypothetical protein
MAQQPNPNSLPNLDDLLGISLDKVMKLSELCTAAITMLESRAELAEADRLAVKNNAGYVNESLERRGQV